MIVKNLADTGRVWIGALDPDAPTVVDATSRCRADFARALGLDADHPDIAVTVTPQNSGLEVRACYVPGWPA